MKQPKNITITETNNVNNRINIQLDLVDFVLDINHYALETITNSFT